MLKDPQALVVLSGTEIIKDNQYEGKNYEIVFVPKSVTKIGRSAFKDCKNLRNVVFEDDSKLEKIEFECFCNSSFQEIILPKTLKQIRWNTFKNCKNL